MEHEMNPPSEFPKTWGKLVDVKPKPKRSKVNKGHRRYGPRVYDIEKKLKKKFGA